MFICSLTFNNFQYYNLWISLLGGILCLIVMFLIDWITALITFIVTIALYLFVSYRNPSESSVALFVGRIDISLASHIKLILESVDSGELDREMGFKSFSHILNNSRYVRGI